LAPGANYTPFKFTTIYNASGVVGRLERFFMVKNCFQNALSALISHEKYIK
jgi:hypothetical protein